MLGLVWVGSRREGDGVFTLFQHHGAGEVLD